MKRGFVILVVLVIFMLAGGAITSNLLQVPTIVQSEQPDASVFNGTPEQSTQLFLWVGFVLINVIGAGVTLGVVFWLLNRGLSRGSSDDVESNEAAVSV